MMTDSPAGLGFPCSDRAKWGAAPVPTATSTIGKRILANAANNVLPAFNDAVYLGCATSGGRDDKFMDTRLQYLQVLGLAECIEWKVS